MAGVSVPSDIMAGDALAVDTEYSQKVEAHVMLSQFSDSAGVSVLIRPGG